MRPLVGIGLFAVVVVSSNAARAAEDDLPVGNENPRVVPVLVADTYYAHHDPPPAGRSATLASTGSRHNEIAINLAAVGGRLEHAKMTGAVVLHAGSSVDAVYSGVAAPVRSQVEIWKHIQLANVGWKMGDLHVEAGIMPSLIERESFVSTENWNYTRAIIADSTPYYVTGLRATYRLVPTFAVAATVFNGWDHHGDRNKQKSGQLRFLWEPTDKWSISDSAVAGAEQVPVAGQKTSYRLFDALAITYRLHARVQLALEGWIGVEQNLRVEDPRKGTVTDAYIAKNPMYYGGALWGRWQFADTTYIALRGEAVDDRYGVITGRGARTVQEPAPGQRLLAGTITLGWQPHPRLLARVEAMHRIADEPFFAGGDPQTYEENVAATGTRQSFVSEARKSSTSFLVSAAFSL
jgi:hypothetical protein